MNIRDRKKGAAKVTPVTVLKYIGSKIKTAILLFVALVTMTLTLAAPAQAGPVDWIMGEGENFILSTFCTEPGSGYKVKPVGLPLPNSGDSTNPDHLPSLNAAEIMGNGLHYTNWWGWKDNESVQGDGKDTGVGAVAAVGGKDNNGGLDTWGKDVDAGTYPVFELQGSCLEGETMFNTSVGNVMLQSSYMLVWGTSFLLDLNSGGIDGTLGTTMSGITTNITSTILDQLVWQFWIPFTMLGALVIAYYALVKRQITVTMSGVLKLVVSMLIIAFLTNNPNAIVNAGSEVQKVAGSLTTSLVTGGLAAIDPVAKDMCKTGVIDGDKVAADNRQTTCILWYAFYYKPWVVGQFGSDSSNYMIDGGIKGGETNVGDPLTGGRIDKEIVSGGYKSNDDVAHVFARSMVDDGTMAVNMKTRSMYNATAYLLARDTPVSEFAGEVSSTRIAYGAAASVAAICALLMVGSIMIPLMGLTLALFFMGIFVALKMLISLITTHSIQPHIESATTILGIFVQMIMLNLFAGTALVVIVTIAANTLDTLSNMFFCIAICFAGIVYRKKILKAFDIGTYFGMATNTDMGEGMGVAKMTHMAHHAVGMVSSGGKKTAQGTGVAAKTMTSRNLPVSDTGGAGKRPSKAPTVAKANAQQSESASRVPESKAPKQSVVKSVKENGVRATAAAGVASAKENAKVAKEQRREDREHGVELRKAGYRNVVPLSTRGTAAVAGFAVTSIKGKEAGSATANAMLAKGGAKQVQRNETAVAKVEEMRQRKDAILEKQAEERNTKRDAFHAPRINAENRIQSNETAAFENVKTQRVEAENTKREEEERRQRVIAQEERRMKDAEVRKEYREKKKKEQQVQPKNSSPAAPALPPRRTEKPEERTNRPTPPSR